jgi:biotin-(acetyl-CoA carboxylase) ligase
MNTDERVAELERLREEMDRTAKPSEAMKQFEAALAEKARTRLFNEIQKKWDEAWNELANQVVGAKRRRR